MSGNSVNECLVVLCLTQGDGDYGSKELEDDHHTHQAYGSEFGVDRSQFSTLHAVGDQHLQHRVVAGTILLSDLLDTLGAGQHLSIKDACEVWLAEHVCSVGLDERRNATGGRAGVACCFYEEGTHSRRGPFEHGAIQALFVTKVVMNHGPVNARFSGDIADCCTVVSAFGEKFLGCRRYSGPRFRIVYPFSRHVILLIKRLIKE